MARSSAHDSASQCRGENITSTALEKEGEKKGSSTSTAICSRNDVMCNYTAVHMARRANSHDCADLDSDLLAGEVEP